MTTVVAVRCPGGVVVGSDSRAVFHGQIAHEMAGGKVFSPAPGVLLSAAGNLRLLNLVRAFRVPDSLNDARDPAEWVIGEFVPALVSHLSAAGYPGEGRDGSDDEVLIVIRDRFWRLGGQDWAVVEPSVGYASIGSGECYAIGAIHAIESALPALPARQVVELAIAAAASFDCGTGGKVHIVSTEGVSP